MSRYTPAEIERLRAEIRSMSTRSLLYKALKDELGAIGHWKNLPRRIPNCTFVRTNSKFGIVQAAQRNHNSLCYVPEE